MKDEVIISSILRSIYRFFAFFIFAMFQATKCMVTCCLIAESDLISYRATWLCHSCRYLIKLFGIQLRSDGNLSNNGILVCNHLSYLDIIALAATQPMVFTAKSEIRRWLGVGLLARCAGTVFIDRDNKRNLLASIHAIEKIVLSGVTVCVFAEGTSSDGTSVLPFKSPLFASAINTGQIITPARVSYFINPGCVAKDICYWGDMLFLPHFFRLLSIQRINSLVVYGTPTISSDRKNLAMITHNAVEGLKHFVHM